jgi:S-(hydroxymethyl)glutathione dehydrogenase/alcohol dehydrogenase
MYRGKGASVSSVPCRLIAVKTLAAVLVETGRPLELAELEIPLLKPGQILVEVGFSGVCHTQVLEARGHRGPDLFLPHCLGHEGSGTVLEVGPGVTKVKPGEAVVLSWMQGSGANIPGTTYQWNGRTVNSGAITTFSRHSVLSENRVTPVPKNVAPRTAALLGCAVPTGFGAVFNAAQPRPGQSIAIFGVGGIGLCAVAAAAISGCMPVVAIDVRSEKLEWARQMGATHSILAGGGDPVEEILKLCPGGADFAIEASGRTVVMEQALKIVRARGGTAVVIGNARQGERLALDPRELNQGKRLFGTWGGDNLPDRDFPRYGRLLGSGRVSLSPLLGREYSLEDINRALDELEAGEVARPLVDMSRQ